MPAPPAWSVIDIVNGFESNYLCSVCQTFIEQEWKWNSFATIAENYNEVSLICPICGTKYEGDITGLTRPWFNCAYNLAHFPSTFDPSNISGLQLWLDAAQSSTVTVVGGQVTKWADKTANNYDFINHLGIVTYSSNEIVFPGSAYLYNTVKANFSFMHEDSFTIFSVIRFTSPGAVYNIIGNNASLSNRGFWYASRGNRFYHWVTRAVPGTSVFSFNTIGEKLAVTNQNTVHTTVFDNSVAVASVCANQYRNGSFTFDTTKLAEPNTGLPWGQLVLGSIRFNYLVTPFNGGMSEVLLYNRNLTDTERTKVEHYLMTKWSI